jgi:hypothetical protein
MRFWFASAAISVAALSSSYFSFALAPAPVGSGRVEAAELDTGRVREPEKAGLVWLTGLGAHVKISGNPRRL